MSSSNSNRYSASRFTPKGGYDFTGPNSSFAYTPPPKQQPDALDDILGIASSVAPLAGTAIGAGVGSVVPGVGTLLGAGLGGAAGEGLGMLGQGLKSAYDAPKEQQQQQYLDQQDERKARAQAAMGILDRFA